MARTWSEIQADMDKARAAREAASAAEAKLEAEGDAKVAPWALGLAALAGLGAWAVTARTPVTPTPAPTPAPRLEVRESWADRRRREAAKDDARWSRDQAVAAKGRAMDAWSRAVSRFDGRADSDSARQLDQARARYDAAAAVANAARDRYNALA